MSSVGTAASGAVGRLLTGRRAGHDDYVFCAADRFWFRPVYTEGKCPLCGVEAPGGTPPLPLLVRIDRLALGMAVLAFVSVNMAAVVLFMFLKP